MSKKAKRALVIAIALALAAGSVTFGVLNARKIMPWVDGALARLRGYYVQAPQPQEDTAHELYQQKHPYIGRLPAKLGALLTQPNDLYGYGTQLHTVETPYGLQDWFGADRGTWEQYRTDPEKQRIFQNNALITMALIDNCDFVEYSLKWDDEKISYNNYPSGTHLYAMGRDGFTLKYTKEWANEALGSDIKQWAETEETFRAFLKLIGEMEFPPVEPEAIDVAARLARDYEKDVALGYVTTTTANK